MKNCHWLRVKSARQRKKERERVKEKLQWASMAMRHLLAILAIAIAANTREQPEMLLNKNGYTNLVLFKHNATRTMSAGIKAAIDDNNDKVENR